MRRLDGIDGMRGLAALSVLVFHVGVFDWQAVPEWIRPLVSHGWLGVPLFFVLSGLLLYRPFASAALSGGPAPPLGRYFRARILRIFPAYWLALSVMMIATFRSPFVACMSALVGGLIYARSRRIIGLTLAAASVVLVVVVIVAAPSTWAVDAWPMARQYLMLQRTGGYVIGPAWTLQIELAFYLMLPLFALALARAAARGTTASTRAKRLAMMLACLIAAGFAEQVVFASRASQPLLIPSYISLFGVGMLLAVVLELRPLAPPRLSTRVLRASSASAAGLVAALATLLVHVGPAQVYPGGVSVFYTPLIAFAFALVIAAVITTPPGVGGRVLRSRPLTELGAISYGIYLWHSPIILGAHRLGYLTGPFFVDVILVAAVTIACAELSWRLIERPALRLKFTRAKLLPPLTDPVPAPVQ